MSGVYSVEDLLKLRASPLISRPPNLPPIEEWMGSQEPVTKKPLTRGRQEDGSHHTHAGEAFQKRPTLDPSLRKSTTDPERIVLGPPRRSFASSTARNFGKLGTHDSEDPQKQGNSRHERNRTGEDIENRPNDRKSGQFGGVNGRYNNKHEHEHDRSRRRHEEEDGDTFVRKDHDRRWNREEKANEDFDDGNIAKPGFKRDPHPRSRFEQSWLRSDRGTEEARRDNDRPGWKRDRPRDGEWDMPSKAEVDPEWMDAADAAEPAQAHTQEDFQRWKERMKAAANGTGEEKQASAADGVSKQTHEVSAQGPMSPDLGANSMDKFFAKFNEKRSVEDKGPVAKPQTKSKFASLFGPPSETKPESPAAPAVPAAPSSPEVIPVPPHSKAPMSLMDQLNSTEADQAGFKRILEMLGKREMTLAPEAQKLGKAENTRTERQSVERHDSPDLMALFKQNPSARQTPVSHGSAGLEFLIESRSPAEGHRRQATPNKDELLLNLLRQAEISAKPPQREYIEQRPPPGLFSSMSDPPRGDPRQLAEERQDMERTAGVRGNSRQIFDDPAISNMSYPEAMSNRQGLQRRPTNGYEDPYLDRLRQQEQPKSMQPPPSMPRPPGLEQMPRLPPGWQSQGSVQHQQQQQQQQQQQPPPPLRQGPPPGINMPRGMQPPFGGPQQGPMPPIPQQGQRPTQRKYTGDSALPNFPPGIGPPPGFMSNGPPPGFHHNNGNNQAQNYARYGMGSEGQAPPSSQGPPNMNRAFMEMYGVERGGVRGGNGGVPLPPGFR